MLSRYVYISISVSMSVSVSISVPMTVSISKFISLSLAASSHWILRTAPSKIWWKHPNSAAELTKQMQPISDRSRAQTRTPVFWPPVQGPCRGGMQLSSPEVLEATFHIQPCRILSCGFNMKENWVINRAGVGPREEGGTVVARLPSLRRPRPPTPPWKPLVSQAGPPIQTLSSLLSE